MKLTQLNRIVLTRITVLNQELKPRKYQDEEQNS